MSRYLKNIMFLRQLFNGSDDNILNVGFSFCLLNNKCEISLPLNRKTFKDSNYNLCEENSREILCFVLSIINYAFYLLVSYFFSNIILN